ncbi:MAG: Dabb family protein [Deltaproteobacteria bacterium]|nr:Dabb family protein [Deltaproteobacteria bacterium]
MIKHLVLAKFKPGVTTAEIAALKKSLAALPALIPEIKGYEFGEDIRPEKTLDFALVSTFEDTASLKRYLVQPDHAVVGKYIRSLCESLQIVDFEQH